MNSFSSIKKRKLNALSINTRKTGEKSVRGGLVEGIPGFIFLGFIFFHRNYLFIH
jgi:hypothetical protein